MADDTDDLKIKLYQTDYYAGIGQPYLLLAWRPEKLNLFVEAYYFLIQESGKYTIKTITIRTNESSSYLFPDIETLLQKEILPQSSYFVFNKFIFPVIENNKSYYTYKHPQFEEIDTIRLFQLKRLCPKALGQIREASSIADLKDYITMMLSINIDISPDKDV
jgi:hypothetical protein